MIRHESQGTVVHNDDTGMRVLMLKRDPSDQRRGRVHQWHRVGLRGRKIALSFRGSRHAGENIAQVLKQRGTAQSDPDVRCVVAHVPKLPTGVEILLANCLAYGRRRFVEAAENFPKRMPLRAGDARSGVSPRCRSDARTA